ncbi:MAG: acyl-CoA thioester hydrolase/BAAT C-terminal domain-containing protein [Ekhidna sp.]
MIKKIITGTFCVVTFFLVLLFTHTPSKHKNHGKIDLSLYMGDSINQPLIVGFGGGEGGNAWASDYWETTRNAFLKEGYAFLAIGYFGSENTPTYLDRISLNAIYDSIISKSNHPLIDQSKIALIGGSKGAELALNLSSRFNGIDAVVAFVPSHVSFPALTMFANTSSWEYNGKEVRFTEAPFKTIFPALQGNHLEAFSMMLEDENEVINSTIKVENVNGPILLISATRDEMWPSNDMSNKIMKRLEKNEFKYEYKHISIEGSHNEPLKHFDKVLHFLDSNFK